MKKTELIALQLQGKSAALDRYDAILWKIRAGYVAILYGVAGLLWNKGVILPDGDIARQGIGVFLFLTAGFSLSALLVDLSFLKSKLRVVEAYNDLLDLALDLGDDRAANEPPSQELRRLLHLAGESGRPVSAGLLRNNLLTVIPIYCCMPVLLALFFSLR